MNAQPNAHWNLVDIEHSIEICNRLLRTERAAVETYDQAIVACEAEPVLPEIMQIRDEHAECVAVLEEDVLSMGGVPDDHPGAWSGLAPTARTVASALGKSSALKLPQIGEHDSKYDCKIALDDENLMLDCKNLIRARLLRGINLHIEALQRLQQAA